MCSPDYGTRFLKKIKTGNHSYQVLNLPVTLFSLVVAAYFPSFRKEYRPLSTYPNCKH